MTSLNRAMRESLPRNLIEAAERVTTQETDCAPNIQLLLEELKRVELRHQQAVANYVRMQEAVQKADGMVAEIDSLAKDADDTVKRLAVAYLRDEASAAELDAAIALSNSLAARIPVLRAARPALVEAANEAMKAVPGHVVSDANMKINEARAEESIRLARLRG